jgi:hypothetical protein
MFLYLIQFDGEPYYVEAKSFTAAIIAWGAHVSKEWGNYDGTEQPDSVALVHDSAVIRGRADD